MERIKAVFPGSFDPFTKAHERLCSDATNIGFDVTILICGNPNKGGGMFNVNERKEIIEQCFYPEDRVKVEIWDGLVTDYCDQHGICYIIRGIDYSNANEELDLANIYFDESSIRTLFFPLVQNKFKYIRSSRVREYIKKHEGMWISYVPDKCVSKIVEILASKND